VNLEVYTVANYGSFSFSLSLILHSLGKSGKYGPI
jgi:hypothetical protein